MSEDAALQIGVKFTFHICRQAWSIGGRRRVRQERSRDGRQSRYRALCGSDRVVRKSQEQAPYVHPPYSIEGRDVTGNMLGYTAHMYISKEKTSSRGRQAKEYTPHPLWCVLPDQVSESTCKRRRQDTGAMLRSGGGVPGGRSQRYRGKNTVYFTYPPG